MPPHRSWLTAGQAVASIVRCGRTNNYVNAVEDNNYLKTAGSWNALRRATTTQLTQSKRHHNNHYNHKYAVQVVQAVHVKDHHHYCDAVS